MMGLKQHYAVEVSDTTMTGRALMTPQKFFRAALIKL
jgi:hypothetical protein